MRPVIRFLSGAALLLGLLAEPATAETVNLMSFPVLFQERYTKAVIAPFEKANPGIKVSYFGLPSSAQMLGTLRAQKAAPQIDVVIMDLAVSKAGTDEGLLAKLDETEIPNIKDLVPEARRPELAGVGVTFDNLVLLTNTDLVKERPDSWYALRDKAYAGRVAIPAMPDIVGLSLTVILDKAEGGQDPLKSVDKGIAALGTIAPGVQTWDPRPEVYAPIVSGQAAIGAGWNARAQINHDLSGGKLAAVLPKEGSVFQANTINLTANSPNAAAAKKFIDYALSPEAQKAFTEAMFYAPSNAKAREAVSPGAIARTALAAAERMIPLDWIAIAGRRDAILEQWRRRVIPLSR